IVSRLWGLSASRQSICTVAIFHGGIGGAPRLWGIGVSVILRGATANGNHGENRAMDRLRSEQHFHDRQARERAAGVSLRFDDAAYLDHETWIRPAFARLGAVRGLRVLDYGC